MTAEPSPAFEPDVCPLCATVVAADVRRCPGCGYHLVGIGERPGPFTRAVFWWTAIGFLAVYLSTLVVVASTH